MFGVSRRHRKMGSLDRNKYRSNQTRLLREERDLVKLLNICDGDYCCSRAENCSQPLVFSLSPFQPNLLLRLAHLVPPSSQTAFLEQDLRVALFLQPG